MSTCSSPWGRTLAILPAIALVCGPLCGQQITANDPARSDPAGGAGATVAVASEDAAGVEFFEKKVRPLLVARCQGCHGAEKQKGNLRLDSREAVLKGGDTAPAVVPHKPDESLLVDAIRYGETYQMPPKSQLPADEIATLVHWVRIGAPWGREAVAESVQPAATFDLWARAKHWSFQPLADVKPPEPADLQWVQTPIDRFILSGLEAAGLKPAPPADKRTLLRRVTFDLIGLPPTPAEIEAFLADDSAAAYTKVVDRLLASPHYGERWARHWLDLVRYAETHGHEFDFEMPNAYRYRDYVIRAMNADVPFDQFVVEHVAGDLLNPPRRHPTEGFNESIIGTGFYFFGEAKHSPVDVRQDEADRIDNQIDVLAKTFLGLTVSCARCHDHKFDAISTKDYYALAGYLQSSRYQQAFLDPPAVLAGVCSELRKLGEERQRLCSEISRSALAPQLEHVAAALLAAREAPADDAWAKRLRETALVQTDDVWHPWVVLGQAAMASASDASADFSARRAPLAAQLKDRLKTAAGEAAVVFADFNQTSYRPWDTTGAAFGDGPVKAFEWMPTAGGSTPRVLEAAAAHSGRVSPKLRGVLRSPTFAIEKPKIFYRLYGTGGRVRLILDGMQLIQNPIYGGLNFEPESGTAHWHEQDVSKWIGHRAYIEVIDDGDGFIALGKVVFSDGSAPATSPNRLVVEMLDDSAITSPALLAQKYQALVQQVVAEWLAGTSGQPGDASDRARIVNSALEQHLSQSGTPDAIKARIGDFHAALASLDERRTQIESRIAPPQQAMAMADGTAENERVFVRGSHKTLGDEVGRRFLEVLGGTRHAAPAEGSGRLELARQLVSPDDPLLPRVIVNRLWQHHFGEGIVRSPDDFGVMGQRPTQPELLDWLAAQQAREGWSLKQMHRLMVLSATYQMSSRPRDDADRIDPQNRLWHRMSVRRLEVESIRDAILAVSGRANPALCGPSVPPYLTEYMTGRGRPKDSGPLDGDGRRSIYLAVRRNFLSPMFLAFDYPIPFTTIGRRTASNVPAQALAMLNNPFVLEQSRLWAQRVLSEPDRSPLGRVRAMYVTALGRVPEESEERAALDFLNDRDAGPTADNVQAWTDFAHVLFNVKEFIFIP